MLLQVDRVVKTFKGLTALNGVSFTVNQGDFLGIIGLNGAGKSVMVNIITGFYKPTSGTVMYKGQNITGMRPDQIAHMGISRTFQLSTLFFNATVAENLTMGVRIMSQMGMLEALLRTPRMRGKEQAIFRKVRDIAEFLQLERYMAVKAGALPYGLQKVVAIGMALAGDPKMVLLDEPLTGLNSNEAEKVMSHIEAVRRQGTTVLLVEHNMRAVMGYCNAIVVLSFGQKIAEGTPVEIRNNEKVIKAYLGE